jgi:hypothetical protein
MEGSIWNQRKSEDLILENLGIKLKSQENLWTKFNFSLIIGILNNKTNLYWKQKQDQFWFQTRPNPFGYWQQKIIIIICNLKIYFLYQVTNVKLKEQGRQNIKSVVSVVGLWPFCWLENLGSNPGCGNIFFIKYFCFRNIII